MPQDENLQNLRILLAAMSKDHLGKTDFTDAFKKVLDFIKQINERNKKEIADIKQALETFNGKLKDDTNLDIGNLKTEINKIVNQKLSDIDVSHRGKILELDDKMANVKDGKDADEKRVIKKTLKELVKEIPSIKKILKGVKAEKVRDSLEKLEGDERFNMSMIRGLSGAIKKLRDRPIGRVGGGFSYIAMDRHIIDPYEPTGTINGSNKEFGLTRTPNPAASLKVFRGGAKQSTNASDYTLSGKTITFATAPVVGETIEVEHRI